MYKKKEVSLFTKGKLVEIIVDKFLIALLIMLAGWQINQSIERYKLIETERVKSVAEFSDAMQEVWSAVYDYELHLNETVQAQKNLSWLKEMEVGDGSRNSENTKDELLKAEKEKQLLDSSKGNKEKELISLINQRKFILGHHEADNVYKYVALLNIRFDIEVKLAKNIFSKENYETTSLKESLDEFNKSINQIKVNNNSMNARERAISQLPR